MYCKNIKRELLHDRTPLFVNILKNKYLDFNV